MSICQCSARDLVGFYRRSGPSPSTWRHSWRNQQFMGLWWEVFDIFLQKINENNTL